ncbi:MAG: hypothetical protein ACRDVF_10680 [Microbacterium sp.]
MRSLTPQRSPERTASPWLWTERRHGRTSPIGGVREQVDALLAALPSPVGFDSASSPDGHSARVTVSTLWHAPLVSLFVTDGVRLEATGTSRTALG